MEEIRIPNKNFLSLDVPRREGAKRITNSVNPQEGRSYELERRSSLLLWKREHGSPIGAYNESIMPPVAPTHNTRVIAFLVVVVVILVGFLVWANAGALANLWRTQTAISFETIDQGQNGTIEERKNYVISNTTEWQDLWSLIHSSRNPAPPVPSVDFTREKVLVAFQGQQPSGGYQITFESVVDSGDALDVYVKEYVPGAGCATATVITAPYHIVKIPKFDKALVSHSERAVVACE